MKKLLKWVAILILAAFPWVGFPYSSVTVPTEDPVYRQLDKLAGFGLIKTMIVGQRPYVRSEIGRLIAEAIQNYPDFEAKFRDPGSISVKESGKRLAAKVFVDGIMANLKHRYHDELVQRGVIEGKVPTFAGDPLDYVQADYLYLDEPKSLFLPNNGLGPIDAVLQPLVENREGRHYQNGSNFSFETHHWARLGKYFSIQVQPRFQFQIAKAPFDSETQVYLQRLNGHFTWNKLDIEIGRDSINWGPTPRGGMFFSRNARPLDFVKIASISPFYYPFFFKKIGQNEMSLVMANLGPEQFFPDAWLISYKISNRKNQYLEFGFNQSLILGGDGAPPISFGQGVVQFFDMSSNNTNSYRNFGIELIGRIPKLRGLEIYGQVDFSDFTTNPVTLLSTYTSYLAGAYLPRLTSSGNLDFRVEYRRLSPRYGRSPLFQSGYTENQNIIGDPLGPDSWAVFFQTFYDLNPKNILFFDFQFSHQNNTVFAYDPNDNVVPVNNLGDRNFYRYQAGWRHIWNPHFESRLGLGLQQVQGNISWSPNERFNYVVETGFTWHFNSVLGKDS